MDATQLRSQLAHFTGSATFTRNGLVRSVLMTEGVMLLTEHAGAHWLADAIASYLHDDRARSEEFQAWRFVVDGTTRQAMLRMTDGNSDVPIITQALDYTDFPLDEITLWLIASGDHRVLMLPSEY